jgi:hypothetical protein
MRGLDKTELRKRLLARKPKGNDVKLSECPSGTGNSKASSEDSKAIAVSTVEAVLVLASSGFCEMPIATVQGDLPQRPLSEAEVVLSTVEGVTVWPEVDTTVETKVSVEFEIRPLTAAEKGE